MEGGRREREQLRGAVGDGGMFCSLQGLLWCCVWACVHCRCFVRLKEPSPDVRGLRPVSLSHVAA